MTCNTLQGLASYHRMDGITLHTARRWPTGDMVTTALLAWIILMVAMVGFGFPWWRWRRRRRTSVYSSAIDDREDEEEETDGMAQWVSMRTRRLSHRVQRSSRASLRRLSATLSRPLLWRSHNDYLGLEVLGLPNVGNSCFGNSVLQAVASLPELALYCEAVLTEAGPNELCIMRAFSELIQEINAPSTKRVANYIPDPIPLVDLLDPEGKLFDYQQQDAQEFLLYLQSKLEQEMANFSQKNERVRLQGLGLHNSLRPSSNGSETSGDSRDSLLSPRVETVSNMDNDPFPHRLPYTGMSIQRVACTRCGYYDALRMESFSSLMLEIPRVEGGRRARARTISDCLQALTQVERIPSVPCRMCSLHATSERLHEQLPRLRAGDGVFEAVKERMDLVDLAITDSWPEHPALHGIRLPLTVESDKTKQTALTLLPQVLCLALNRTAISSTGAMYKDTSPVTAPLTLDMAAYMFDMDKAAYVEGSMVSEAGSETRVGTARRAGHGLEAELDSLSTAAHVEIDRELVASPNGLGQSPIYTLRAIVSHHGNAYGGHYYTYRRSTSSDQWYFVSDTTVRKISTDEIARLETGVMFMYERDPS